MAQDKKSVLLYCDLIHTIEKLDDKKAGQFFKHYLRYVNDLNPEPPNQTIDLLFEQTKQHLKRDLKKYEVKCLKNKQNVLKRWDKKNTNEYERIRMNTKDTDKGKDKGKDKDKVNVINSNKKPIFLIWLNYKKEIKKEVKSKSTYNTLVKRFNKESLPKCEWVVNQSIENNWQGLFWDKYITQKSKKPTDNLTF